MTTSTKKIWTQNDSIESALELPLGRCAVNARFRLKKSVKPDDVLKAVRGLKEAGIDLTVASQAALLVKAQEEGVAFQEWGEFVLI